MKDIILGIIGAAAAVFGLILLLKMLGLRKKGIITQGEVVSAERNNKNSYTHTLKYTINGREYTEKDKAGYTDSFKAGEMKEIVCEPNAPENFRYKEELRVNLIAAVSCIIIGTGFVLRFIVL